MIVSPEQEEGLSRNISTLNLAPRTEGTPMTGWPPPPYQRGCARAEQQNSGVPLLPESLPVPATPSQVPAPQLLDILFWVFLSLLFSLCSSVLEVSIVLSCSSGSLPSSVSSPQ